MQLVTKYGPGCAALALDGVECVLEVHEAPLQWPQLDKVEHIATKCVAAAAPFGGPIAVCRVSHPDYRTEVAIYTGAGRRVASFDVGGTPTFMCWNDRNDDLIVVLDDGTVTFFTSSGLQTAVVVDLGAKPLRCASTGNGVAVFTAPATVHHLDCQFRGSGEYKAAALQIGLFTDGSVPTAMAVIQREAATSHHVEVLLPTDDSSSRIVRAVFAPAPLWQVCKTSEGVDQQLDGTVVAMAVSRVGGNAVAMVMDSGAVARSTGELHEVRMVAQLSDSFPDPPAAVVWLGENVIGVVHLCGFDSTLSLLRPGAALLGDREAEVVEESLPAECLLCVEPDGLRVVGGADADSDCRHTFYHVIPPCAARFYESGTDSLNSSALLRRAYDEYRLGAAKSVRTLKAIADLDAAVRDALLAASFSTVPQQQQRLLRVASYGKTFCPNFDAQLFVDRCKRIRVMNALRAPGVGMNITMAQLCAMELDMLLSRLLRQREFRVAFHAAQTLGGPTGDIIGAWATAKIDAMVEAGAADDAIYGAIVQVASLAPGLPFVPIAEAARDKGRPALFRRLLDHEPSLDCLVDTLLLHDDDGALARAVEVGDADLLLKCFVKLGSGYDKLVPRLRAMSGATDAERTAQDLAAVFLCHFTSSQYTAAAVAYAQWRPQTKLAAVLSNYFGEVAQQRKQLADAAPDGMLQESKASLIESACNVCSEAVTAASAGGGTERDKDREAELAAARDALTKQRRLMAEQAVLARRFSEPRFLTASPIATLQLLWEAAGSTAADDAEAIGKRIGATDRAQQWARVRGLVERKDATALVAWATKSKPTIGLLPVVEALLKLDAGAQALPLIAKIPRIEDRLEQYIAAGEWAAAAADCIRSREPEMVQQLRSRANGNQDALSDIARGTQRR